MPAEAWVALILGIVGIIGSVFTASWYLSGKLARQDTDMNGIKRSLEKIENVMEAIAVDRDRAARLEARMIKVEQWYDELRRGEGFIRPPPRPT